MMEKILLTGMTMMAVSCGFAGNTSNASERDSVKDEATVLEEPAVLEEVEEEEEIDEVDEIEEELPFVLPEDLRAYDSVVENFRNQEDVMFFSGALFDITGDDVPELWILRGSCEAGKKLYVYTLKKGRAVKIFEGAGDHSSFSKGDGKVYQFSTNCGGGFLAVYEYKRGKVHMSKWIEFSLFNEEGEPRAVDEKRDKELQKLLSEGDEGLDFHPILIR